MLIPLSLDMPCNDLPLAAFPSDAPLVLIADDDALIRLVLRQAMEDEGYQVAEACNGQECLEQYAAQRPALVLLDGKMPIVDGFTCCEMLQQRYGNATAPIWMLTSLDNAVSVEQAFAVGVSDYITKPFNWAILSQRIRRLLRGLEFKKPSYPVDDPIEVQMHAQMALTGSECAVTLNRITARLHNILDESQVLQAVAQELADALSVSYCTGVIAYADPPVVYVQEGCAVLTADPLKLMQELSQYSEVACQIAQGQQVHFCSVISDANLSDANLSNANLSDAKQTRMSVLVCPISSSETTFGNLWVISNEAQVFTTQETQLVQQIASQCAIATRNARLHHAYQCRVQELEQLTQDKNEVLAAMARELRSPLVNMRLATRALEQFFNLGQGAQGAIAGYDQNFSKGLTWLKILNNECEKELSLVNDLLDLQQLETGRKIWNESASI
jgi:CheY-like chemotaxis protein